jgi:hypothetical protein
VRLAGGQDGYRTVMRYGGGVGIGTLIYVIIGAFVAGADNYFDHLGSVGRIVSALLAILLWPLLLFGIDFSIR